MVFVYEKALEKVAVREIQIKLVHPHDVGPDV